MRLHNKNELKKNSLEDCLYFTLRDIFGNAESAVTLMEANAFNRKLTNGVCYEARTPEFQYTNILH
jgi:hypothetical protein